MRRQARKECRFGAARAARAKERQLCVGPVHANPQISVFEAGVAGEDSLAARRSLLWRRL